MARYEHLPIYKKAMDLTIYLEKIVRGFSRYHKYTLGSELREKSREIVGVIIKANSTVERLPVLLGLREKLESTILQPPPFGSKIYWLAWQKELSAVYEP